MQCLSASKQNHRKGCRQVDYFRWKSQECIASRIKEKNNKKNKRKLIFFEQFLRNQKNNFEKKTPKRTMA